MPPDTAIDHPVRHRNGTEPATANPAEISAPIRTPHDPTLTDMPLTTMLDKWERARQRSFLAKFQDHTPPPADDLFTELALGVRLATELTAGRWCTIATLLHLNAADSWTTIGTALDMSATAARDGFLHWITSQLDLHHRTSTIGLTDTEANALSHLANALPL